MGARQRRDRAIRAAEEGRQARRDKKTKDQCPYKQSDWGLGGFWRGGWEEEDQAIARKGNTGERSNGP